MQQRFFIISLRGCLGGLQRAVIHSWLSRFSAARGSSIGFSLFSPTKVEARKSFLFTQSSFLLKIKNTWLILIFFCCNALCSSKVENMRLSLYMIAEVLNVLVLNFRFFCARNFFSIATQTQKRKYII